MKKLLAFFLAAALMFSLAACGGGVDGTTSKDTQDNMPMQSADENIAENESSIEFEEPFVILDNELATVEITQFYQEEVKYSSDSDPVKESNIVVKVRNNSENEFLFNLQEAYLEDEALRIVMKENAGPVPGKSKTFTYKLQYDTQPDATPISDLNLLYGLEGLLEFPIYNESKSAISDTVEFSFSLKEMTQNMQ